MNRTMEAKRIKYIRQSRARPRTLRMNNGHQKVPQSVDRSKIPEEYLGLFAYRERAKTFIDAYLEALFPSHRKDKEEPIIAGDAFKRIPPDAPAKDTFMMCKLDDGKYVKTTLFFNSTMTCFFFVEYQVLPCVVRRSCTYNNHDRALQVYHLHTIRWVERIYTANVELAP
jgi:hypothetical protein